MKRLAQENNMSIDQLFDQVEKQASQLTDERLKAEYFKQ
jgi:hypothetical protein